MTNLDFIVIFGCGVVSGLGLTLIVFAVVRLQEMYQQARGRREEGKRRMEMADPMSEIADKIVRDAHELDRALCIAQQALQHLEELHQLRVERDREMSTDECTPVPKEDENESRN